MMTQQPTNLIDTLLDFEVLPVDEITLDNTQIDAALEISERIRSEKKKWQTYLNALATFAFQQWLSKPVPLLSVNLEQSSLCQPQYANVVGAVCHLQVGEFKVCLIAIGTASDEVVEMPRAVIDLPEFTAHFYVVVEVIEEQEFARISSFLRYDELLEHQRENNLSPELDWTYSLPLDWFETNIDDLLLYLRCLEPKAIPLPTTSSLQASNSRIQAEVKRRLSQVSSQDVELWQVLTWEQGAVLLTTPDLLNWLYNLPKQHQTAPDKRQVLRESIVNVSLWLRDEMDEFAQGLSWVLLPSLAPQAVPLRSPAQEIEAIITQLGRTGHTQIPPAARAAYQDFQLASARVRLYAVTWSLPTENTLEWSLLLVLGAPAGYNLPHNTTMIISDDTQVLVERALDRNTSDTYIYACVTGTWDETFSVTISLSSGASLTLPPFAFRPE